MVNLAYAALQKSSRREDDLEEAKAGLKAEEASTSGEGASGGAQVSFLTAALMGVALCFHSILEVPSCRTLSRSYDRSFHAAFWIYHPDLECEWDNRMQPEKFDFSILQRPLLWYSLQNLCLRIPIGLGRHDGNKTGLSDLN